MAMEVQEVVEHVLVEVVEVELEADGDAHVHVLALLHIRIPLHHLIE